MTDPREKTKETVIDFGRNPFELRIGEPYSTLKLVGKMGPDYAKEFGKRIRPQFEGFAGDLVLDLSECDAIHVSWVRMLMDIAGFVKKAERRIRVVSTNELHKSFFHDQGIAASFPIVPDLATAVAEVTAKKAVKLDVEFLNPFLEGTVAVLKKIAGVVVKPGTPGVRDAAAPLDGDVSGWIPLKSESFSGSVVLSFPEKTYLPIVSRMLGETHEAITPENRDAASEITNHVFGYAKTFLNEKGYRIQMAIPKVLLGRTPADLPPPNGPRIAIPFESELGPLTIEIRT